MAILLLAFFSLVVLFKAVELKTTLQVLSALYAAFLVRRAVGFIVLRNSIKHIDCKYYLLTPWRSTLWLVLPYIPYITPPLTHPKNDPIARRQRYVDAGCTVSGTASAFSPQATIHIADSKAIKAIVTQNGLFPKPLELYRALSAYGENLIITGGEEWRKHRRIAGPAFCEDTYAFGWSVSVETTLQWLAHLDKRALDLVNTASTHKNSKMVIDDEFEKTTRQLALGIFTNTAFGYRIASPGQSADPVPVGHKYNLKDTLEGALDYLNLFTTVAVPKWLAWLPFGRVKYVMELKAELDLWLSEIVKERKMSLLNGEERKDLLYNLVRANELERAQSLGEEDGLKSSARVLTPEELNGNLFIFLLAGHETCLLALYPDEQEKLFGQIKSIQPDMDADIPYADMHLYTRAQAVIWETLRLYPAVISIPKSVTTERDVVIPTSDRGPGGTGQLFIPRDTLVALDVQSMHYDPIYWPEPEKFVPDRFIDTETYKWDRDAFIPFSAGSRACIGRKFAEVEMIAILVTFCRHYRVVLPESMRGPPEESIEVRQRRVLLNRSMITLVPLNLSLAFQRR